VISAPPWNQGEVRVTHLEGSSFGAPDRIRVRGCSILADCAKQPHFIDHAESTRDANYAEKFDPHLK
jgi:hypothetical protein